MTRPISLHDHDCPNTKFVKIQNTRDGKLSKKSKVDSHWTSRDARRRSVVSLGRLVICFVSACPARSTRETLVSFSLQLRRLSSRLLYQDWSRSLLAEAEVAATSRTHYRAESTTTPAESVVRVSLGKVELLKRCGIGWKVQAVVAAASWSSWRRWKHRADRLVADCSMLSLRCRRLEVKMVGNLPDWSCCAHALLLDCLMIYLKRVRKNIRS